VSGALAGARSAQRALASGGARGRLVLALTSLVGLAGFTWPLLYGARRAAPDSAHAADAPWLFAVLVALLLAIVATEHAAGRMSAKTVAVLAVLAALNSVLRLPGGVAGFNALWFLLIVAARAYGPTFGFLLGAFTLACSALVTGGVGPWLPFQMLAAGWVGLGVGLLEPVPRGGRAEVLALAAYGVAAAVVYDLVMDLWFWPLAVQGPLGFQPGIGLGATLGRFLAFHLATALPWDLTGAIGNAAVLLAVGRPALRTLERAGRRLNFHAVPELLPAGDPKGGPAAAGPAPGSDPAPRPGAPDQPPQRAPGPPGPPGAR
jgi:energy-coupling factor transport system substrate-specific component